MEMRTPSTSAVELGEELDILGQQPLLNIYTQICLCYPMDDFSQYQRTIETLRDGLARLAASFPWVAGHVVNDGAGEGTTGVFKIKPLGETPILRIRDVRDDSAAPTMEDLRQARFPMSMLDESLVAPRNTIPGTSGEAPSETTQIFLVQATFIRGGLVLNFNGQHGCMDMTGQAEIIRLLDKACRHEPFTGEEISAGNLPRRNRIPLMEDSYDPAPELERQMVKPGPPPAFPDCRWSGFVFGPKDLVALKAEASESLASGYVSTDDALTALIWQATTRARLPRLDPGGQSTLARAVDVRRYLNIPAKYPGLIQNMAYHTISLQELVDKPLGLIAQELRAAVDPETSKLGHHSRVLATFMDRTPDKSVVSFTATINPASDIMLSSWAKVDCYGFDFNLDLGKPEAVRRPRFVPVEGLMYLLPKRKDGEIVAAICLRDEDMDRLRGDAKYAKYGLHIG